MNILFQYNILFVIIYIYGSISSSQTIPAVYTSLHKMREGFMVETNLYFGLSSHYFFNKLTQTNNLPIYCIYHLSNFQTPTNNITFKNQTLEYKSIRSSLIFNLFNIKLMFFVIDLDKYSHTNICSERLAFPHKQTYDIQYSLIDAFITQYPTNKKQYSFKPILVNPGTLYLGSIPQGIISNSTFSTSCKVHPLKNEWSCSLRRINYVSNNNNKHIDISIVSDYDYDNYFDIGENGFIYVNEAVLNDIKEKIFSEMINKGICVYERNVNVKYPFKCNCNVVFGNETVFGDIEIVFDNDIKLVFTAKDYFTKMNFDYESNMCYCSISLLSLSENAVYVGNEKLIIMGGSFMERFDLITFDYEQDEVVFYSEKPFYYANDNIPCTIKNIYAIIILSLLMNSILCVCVLFINNKP